jgi:hypothetical protein
MSSWWTICCQFSLTLCNPIFIIFAMFINSLSGLRLHLLSKYIFLNYIWHFTNGFVTWKLEHTLYKKLVALKRAVVVHEVGSSTEEWSGVGSVSKDRISLLASHPEVPWSWQQRHSINTMSGVGWQSVYRHQLPLCPPCGPSSLPLPVLE